MNLVLCTLIGLAIGSFLNVCISRLPLRESVVHPRSRCPQCRKPIASWDNIPVVSYLLLGGKCRNCKTSISVRYPSIEILTGAISLLLYLRFGLSIEWGIYLAFSAALITLAFIDIDHRILPDVITLNGIWIGIVVSLVLATPDRYSLRLIEYAGYGGINPRWIALIASLAGAIAGGGLLWIVGEVFFRVRGIEGMGFGDVKMMAMVGAFLGAPLTLLTIMMGSVLGALIGIVIIKLSGKNRHYELPFGTFLSLAGIVTILYGDAMLQWYVVHMISPSL